MPHIIGIDYIELACRHTLTATFHSPMLPFKTIFLISFLALASGCSIIGYNIERHIDTSKPMPEGTGRLNMPAERARPNVLTTIGAEVDKEIFKALTTRRQQHDMALRDESWCPEGEIKVCSVSAGCACKEKRSTEEQ